MAIENIIPKQNFEQVNERLGEILKLELESQKTKQNLSEPVNVYTERVDPFDPSEILMINTFFDSYNDAASSQKNMQGNYSFAVDIYASGKAATGSHGGKDSTSRRNKFLGMCKYILSNAQYRTLGFERGNIGGVYVESIQTAAPENNNAEFVTMARMTVSVRILEENQLVTGTLMTQALTGVKLDLTEQGYKYELIN